ncbi:DUF4442 domain-containing protein [Flavobacterium sp. UMI-01]|uniref:DUF4442 domain-containing protein n=1 Tax=Flavobacterium sp. UMI-01 TaxID=1441053 RepID=UPI001C7D7BB8|nr:DUF4442 domain-containing protein [Flavobacterium sp. UMI-01]GIZ10247.1 thioesterase [Flavobacterium sp. UMI-01]
MKFTPSKLNTFLIFKLPSAYLCGVRVFAIDEERCITRVRHRWINQNPFHSMYFAVQAMAAELATGALVMNHIQMSNQKMAMLVVQNKAVFVKKATGMIAFECNDGLAVKQAISKSLTSGESQRFWMKTVGKDESGAIVSEMEFEWSIKSKS